MIFAHISKGLFRFVNCINQALCNRFIVYCIFMLQCQSLILALSKSSGYICDISNSNTPHLLLFQIHY